MEWKPGKGMGGMVAAATSKYWAALLRAASEKTKVKVERGVEFIILVQLCLHRLSTAV